MQIPLTLTALLMFGWWFTPLPLNGQETAAQKIDRLKYRCKIGDVDGIGELVEPLFQQVIDGDARFDVVQRHFIATAALKFHLRTGRYARAIVPYLIALQRQKQIDESPNEETANDQNQHNPIDDGLGAMADDSFRRKHLPPIFFAADQHQQFIADVSVAIENGVLRESELTAAYHAADSNQLTTVEQKMVVAISAVAPQRLVTDREILRLVDFFVTYRSQHPTLSHESLVAAIEALRRQKRHQEVQRLTMAFRQHYPDSRRLAP